MAGEVELVRSPDQRPCVVVDAVDAVDEPALDLVRTLHAEGQHG